MCYLLLELCGILEVGIDRYIVCILSILLGLVID